MTQDKYREVHAPEWKKFLGESAGVNLIPTLMTSRPVLKAVPADPDATIFLAGEVSGFEKAVTALALLSAPPVPSKTVEATYSEPKLPKLGKA